MQTRDFTKAMAWAQALQEHHLSRLFALLLTDQPRQGPGGAIRACGLGDTASVSDRFEQEFGIAVPAVQSTR